MKTYKEITEAKGRNFEDSGEATDFMYGVITKMKAKQLENWAKITDQNFGTKTASKLNSAIKAYNAFLDEMEKAE